MEVTQSTQREKKLFNNGYKLDLRKGNGLCFWKYNYVSADCVNSDTINS